jgi:hypothetical protein
MLKQNSYKSKTKPDNVKGNFATDIPHSLTKFPTTIC